MTDALFDISGKTALVTGGAGGIGRMIAAGLVRRGVTTYVTARDAGRAEAAAAELAAAAPAGGRCIGLAADLAAADGPTRLAEDMRRAEPRLHILINNAGANETGKLGEVSQDDWDRVMAVNLRAAFFLAQALAPELRAAAAPEDPARIVNIGSIGGLHIPNWDAFSYGASKAGLHHLTRALAKSLGKDGVTANAIAPGPFPSGLTDTSSEAVKKSIATYVPLGRAGTAEDIEGLIVFLTARAGAYVSGATIPLDGGYIGAL